MEHTKHLWRAGILLLVFVIGGFVARHFLVPDSFGEMGYYRYAALFEFMEQEPRHGCWQTSAMPPHAVWMKFTENGRRKTWPPPKPLLKASPKAMLGLAPCVDL